MIILGIDPGVATSGYGVISCNKTRKELSIIDSGWISTSKEDDKKVRLISTFDQTRKIIKKFQPDIISIERLFFFANAKTAMTVAEFGGVIRLAAALERVDVVEYAPLAIKSQVAGSGKADKKMMKTTVKKMLKIRAPKKKKTHFDDVCDALAVGDTIKISSHGEEFTQTVDSIQIEHEQVKEAKKGQAIGMKVSQEAKENDEVFRVT